MTRSASRIRARILVPMAAVLLTAAVVTFGTTRRLATDALHEEVDERAQAVQDHLRHVLDEETDTYSAIAAGFLRDPAIRAAWREGDREELLARAEMLWAPLRDSLRITHVYFHDLDGRNFLRVHQPPRHGDLIDRGTMHAARATEQLASGYELGPLGTFTLRVVVPWRIDDEPVGYFELGEEITELVPRISVDHDVDIVFLVRKSLLDRSRWEEGMRMLGREGEWSDWADHAASDGTIDRISPEVIARVDSDPSQECSFLEGHDPLLDGSERALHVQSLPLIDARARSVGRILVLSDETESLAHVALLTRLATGFVLLLAVVLLSGCWWYLGRVERRFDAAESALHDSEKNFLDVFYASSDATLLIDGETFVACNDRTVEMLRADNREQVLSTHPSELSPEAQPDGQSSFDKAGVMISTAHEKGSYRFEWTHRRLDGEDFPVEVTLVSLPLWGKALLYCMWRDISAQKRAEERQTWDSRARDALNELLETSLEAADKTELLTSALTIVDHGDVLPDLGAASAHLIDGATHTLHLAAGRRLPEEVTEGCATVPPVECYCGTAALAEDLVPVVTPHDRRLTRACCSPFPAHFCAPIRVGDHPLGILTFHFEEAGTLREEHGYFLESVGDIVAIALQGILARDALARSEGHLRSVFVTANEGILTVDAAGIVRTCNPAAATTFHCRPKDLEGRPLADIVPDLVEELPELEETESVDRRRECEGRRLDGTPIPLSVALGHFREEGASFATVLLHDLTHERQMQAQLSHAQKLESIGQLAAGIAHEINTPTQYITDNVRFLRDAYEELSEALALLPRLIAAPEEADAPGAGVSLDAIAKILEGSDLDYLLEEMPSAIDQSLEGLETVASIVRAMKEFSHPGRTDLVATDLNHAIDNTVTVARNVWKTTAEMELDFDPHLPLVPCLGGEFNQVILNLVVNAAHAIEARGSRMGKITITTRKQDPWVEIRVRDDGCGMSEEIRQRIFEPFFTTKEVGTGTGQGLAISHNVVVDKHRGEIEVESEEGVGTTFVVRLPLVREDTRTETAA